MLASDAGHVVEYLSVVIAELGGSEPSGNGSSSCDGEECTEDERQEERFDLRFEFAGKSFGSGLEEFEGGSLSLMNHGSPFGGTDWDFSNNPIH